MNPLSHGLRVSMICCVATATYACARASREPDQAPAASSVERSESEKAAAAAAPSPTLPQKSAPLPETAEEVQQQPAPEPVPSKPATHQRSRGAASPARESMAAEKKGSPTMRSPEPPTQAPGADPALVYAESPDLVAAVVEFDKQWETLSAARACDDACRAFDSMRRSAKRICDLVVAGDPRQRCRTAQARLNQASRDLAARCTECR